MTAMQQPPHSASACLTALALIGTVAACHRDGVSSPPTATDAVGEAVAGISAEDLATHVEILASDAFEGRFPGSAGEAKTVAYIAAHFARHGLTPAVDGSYLQPVPLVAVTLRPDTTASLLGPNGETTLGVPDDLVVGAAADMDQVDLKGAQIVFVGYGIDAPQYGWNDYADVDVRGKVVVVLWGDPGATREDPEFFEGQALSLFGTTAHKAEQAAAHGAVAMFTLHDPDSIPWSVYAEGSKRPRQQLAETHGPKKVPIQGLIRPQTLRAALADKDAATLDHWRKDATRDDFTATPLPLRLTIGLRRDVEPIVSHNVVGIIEGKTRPEEHVIYTAHWDHVGRGEGSDGDVIFNGAVDNATGTAALLELAEAFASLPQPPDRSIVLVATTAEEQGLLGATWYADHPVLPLADTMGVINMDALFPFGETHGMTVVAMGSSELEDYMASAAQTVGRRLYPDPAPQAGAFFRSDHYPFAHRGVPAIFAVGGPAQDPEVTETVTADDFVQYVQNRYHQVGDEYDAEVWDLGGIVQDVTVYFRTGYAIAMDERRPQWVPSSPFRARHEALRAGS